jgi:hypothetical protein
MKSYTCLLIICIALLVTACGRELTEYDLNEDSFGADTIAQIEEESGIDLPPDVKGLKYHYKPPIDPIVFAKIIIPTEAKEFMEKQIGTLTYSGSSFPKDFANDQCNWWPKTFENVVISKQAFINGYYIEVFLVQEKDLLILYIKYFTI